MTDYVFSDIASNKSIRVRPSPGDEEHYIGLEHMSADSFEVDSYGSETELKGDKLAMSKGDLLFGRRRAYQRKVSIAPFDGIFSAHGMILEPNEKVIDKRFFPFFIRSDYFMDRAISLSVGSLSPTLNWSDIKKETFNLPDLQFQRDAAEVLWKLEELKKRLTNHLSTLDILIKSRFIEMFGTIGDSRFEYSTVEQSCDILDSQRVPITAKDRVPGPYPYYGANGVQDFVADYIFDDELVLLAEDGGHFDEVGRVAYMVSGKCWVNNHAHILKPKPCLSIHYLLQCLNLTDLSMEVNGTTRQKLTQAAMRKIKLPLPPIELQNQFADFVRQVDKSKVVLLKHIEDTKSLQQSIINSCFEANEDV